MNESKPSLNNLENLFCGTKPLGHSLLGVVELHESFRSHCLPDSNHVIGHKINKSEKKMKIHQGLVVNPGPFRFQKRSVEVTHCKLDRLYHIAVLLHCINLA